MQKTHAETGCVNAPLVPDTINAQVVKNANEIVNLIRTMWKKLFLISSIAIQFVKT